tara:strand:- start:31822 stop:32409 length:588 start_codon:yes stop_codon:yes gene_type:complete
MVSALFPLARTTLMQPRVAADAVVQYPLSRDALWTALMLVAAVNTLVLYLLITIAPPSIALPHYFGAPLVMFVLLAGLMVVYVHAIYWAGLAIGGQGSLNAMLSVIVWLQLLRTLAQIGVLVLTILVPPLALLLSVAASIWGLWILLSFIAQVLALPNLLHAAAVLVLSAVGLVLGLGILLTLIGLAAQGVVNNV